MDRHKSPSTFENFPASAPPRQEGLHAARQIVDTFASGSHSADSTGEWQARGIDIRNCKRIAHPASNR
jgi:hypothetical protein